MNLFNFGPNNLDNNVSKIIIGILNIIVYRIPIFSGPFVINNLLNVSKYKTVKVKNIIGFIFRLFIFSFMGNTSFFHFVIIPQYAYFIIKFISNLLLIHNTPFHFQVLIKILLFQVLNHLMYNLHHMEFE